MKHILNTLYINQDQARLHKDGAAIIVRHEKNKIGQFPIIAVGEIVCFGFGITVSPPLAEYCASQGTTISYLSGTGKFLARMEGPVRGNVLLRRKQYRDSDAPERTRSIAASCVAAKILNQRNVLLRHLRNHGDEPQRSTIESALAAMANAHRKIRSAETTDTIRGLEGEAAASYFSCLNFMIRSDDESMKFSGRSRKPPRDRVNALLSFGYALLANDFRSALETVGLDPYVGYLHVERPGRPSLALDLMEEFRAPFVDRLVLTLINRREICSSGFDVGPAGDVQMKTDTRKQFLAAYQARKRECIGHPFVDEDMELGIAFLIQARLLARYIRGDLELYPAFVWR